MLNAAAAFYNYIATPHPQRYIPLHIKNLDMPLLNGLLKPLEALRASIMQYTAASFDSSYTDEDGLSYLVKDNRCHQSDPISPNGTKIQALRYIAAMFIICESTEDHKLKNTLIARTNAIYAAYKDKIQDANCEDGAQLTEEMAEDFALLLKKHLQVDVDHARIQLTMARDLGVALEDQMDVITIHYSGMNNEKVMVELSKHYKISESYYYRECSSITKKRWFQSAKKMAGFSRDQTDTWLDHFFFNFLPELKAKGISPPPSARWEPFPSTTFEVHTCIIDPDGSQRNYFNVRMGIVAAYDINDKKEQVRLAKEQLREVIRRYLPAAMQKYQTLYGDLVAEPKSKFFINYLTFLSPLPGIDSLPKIKDNNSRFAKMAKRQFNCIVSEFAKEYRFAHFRVTGQHTNSAINHTAGLAEFKQFKADPGLRRAKLAETARILNKIATIIPELNEVGSIARVINGTKKETADAREQMEVTAQILERYADKTTLFSSELCKELAMRMRAAFYLHQLLDDKSPYKDMALYQRNIMQAALEYLCMGSQNLALMSCKSSRDRTGIMDCAIKAMLADPGAMIDVQKLNAGIQDNLRSGHNFRTMSRYVSIMKLSQVNKFFNGLITQQTRNENDALTVFAKSLGTPRHTSFFTRLFKPYANVCKSGMGSINRQRSPKN